MVSLGEFARGQEGKPRATEARLVPFASGHVDEPIALDGTAGVQKKDANTRPRLPAPERKQQPVRLDLQRFENPELQAWYLEVRRWTIRGDSP